jgi:uncharacterized protein (TIGR02466 family)
MANLLQPSQLDIQKLIQTLNNGQYATAEKHAQTLLKKFNHVFILHHVLALALDGQQKFNQSVISYQNAIKLQPNTPDLYFNLGIALTHSNKLNEAIDAYQKAITLNPKFFEAYGNLGTIYQQLGQLEAAIKQYQHGLAINPQDARGHYNLGTAFRDQGLLVEAIASYQMAIKLFPNYTDAYNNLGETLRDYGDMNAAVKHYQSALSLNPEHPNANYNMGEFLYLAKKYDEAVAYFDRAQIDDWQARSMYSLYKAERFDAFKARLDHVIQHDPHTSPLISTLATHYAINFNQSNDYNFCKNALDYVYQNSIHALATPNSTLLKELLHDIQHADIAERVQGMLHYGKQSAGNLFKRSEPSFQQLATLVLNEFRAYQSKFASADCALISAFPKKLDFTSSWFVKMQKGGHLSPHIHEIGWISGAVYLAMPAKNGDEGAFEYGTHGDQYPISPSKNISDFPTASIMPNVGDIVLFPSSLFHRTIPFNANEERICIAFDLKPNL